MPATRRRDVPVSPRDRRRSGLVVAGMGVAFLLAGFVVLALNEYIPWVLPMCLLGWGIGAVGHGIIQVIDSRRATR